MKSFALLLLFACPADSVGMARSKQGTMTKDGPSPWLSLLTKSWALPGESQEEQSKGLDTLADNIVQLAKSGQAADPSMQAALESIKQILKDMMEAVTTGNKAAQAEIFKKQAAVAACQVPNATDKAVFKAGLRVSAGDVVSCRAAEKAYYDRYEHCKAEDARCSNTTECCAQIIQPDPHCLATVAPPTPFTFTSDCDGCPKCVGKTLQAKLGYFENKLAQYKEAEAACALSRAGCNSSYACGEFKNQWAEFRGVCNSNQTSFEQAYCDLANHLETSWEKYTLCHTHASQVLAAEEGKQVTLLSGRRQEWRGLLRIECLLDALSSANKEAALQACISKNVTGIANETLSLTFPGQTGNVTDLVTCTEKLESPGTEAFARAYYSAVPSVLMPETLTTFHCVSGMATSHCPIASSTLSLLTRGHYVPHAQPGEPAFA
mmetsp:Transcript_72744/g.170559  ORF Transcript_72744/g.170559 Transcript_72744/m.170559 type:complete len:435 (-) Transcript_72744:24-1328(-)